MEKKKSIKKRKYIRLDLQTKVKFQVKQSKQSETTKIIVPAISKDISMKGIRFTSDRKLEQNDLLKMELFLPDHKEPLNIEGKVAWSNPRGQGEAKIYEVGVELLRIDGKDEKSFMEYFKKVELP